MVAAAASIGGVLVFWGLWKEKKADKNKLPEEFHDLFKDVAKSQKSKSEWGWRILMLGILVKIGTGAAITWSDVRENIQNAKNVANSDARHLPISP